MSSRSHRVAVSITAATVTAILLLTSAAAQMESPLKGQGMPSNDTTDVYMSVYLDRLIEVDEQHYRHHLIVYFVITWADPTAFETVERATASWLAGNSSCNLQCTNRADGVACCDDIYVPSFSFRNVYGFPQDRATNYKMVLLPGPNNSIAWQTFVQGVFYQPMDLSNFPFDSWDLLVQMEFLDSSPPEHPGVTVHSSSAGLSLYTVGKGDPVSQWSIDSITLSAEATLLPQPQRFFQALSDVPSDPSDPLGLTTTDAALLRGCRPGPTTLAASRPVTVVSVKIRITRFWSYHMLNTVLPVLLLGLLSFVVFFLERSDLSSRLGIVVTLFLAMAAVQFVIAENQPASSYVLPTQQVYRIETWQEAAAKKQVLLEARRRHLAALRAARSAAAHKSQHEPGLPTQQDFTPAMRADEFGTAAGTPPPAGSAPAAANGAANGESASVAESSKGASALRRRWHCWGMKRSSGDSHAAPPPAATCHDSAYDAWLAYKIDRWALAVFLAAYCVAITLIYALHSGYINLHYGAFIAKSTRTNMPQFWLVPLIARLARFLAACVTGIWESSGDRAVRTEALRAAAVAANPLKEAQALAHVPPCVRRYLERVAVGADQFLVVKGKQCTSPLVPAFCWTARCGFMPPLLWLTGNDSLAGGRGAMQWRLWGWLPSLSVSGPELDRAMLKRPPHHEQCCRVPPCEARAVLTHRGISVSGTFGFSGDGLVSSFRSDDYVRALASGGTERTPWVVRYREYKQLALVIDRRLSGSSSRSNGLSAGQVLVPTAFEAAWMQPDGTEQAYSQIVAGGKQSMLAAWVPPSSTMVLVTKWGDAAINTLIPVSAAVGITFALWLWSRVAQIKVRGNAGVRSENGREYLLEEEQRGESEIEEKCADLQAAISEGANSFLFTEYKYVSVFMGLFSILIFLLLSSQDGFSTEWKEDAKGVLRAPAIYNGAFSTLTFLVGAVTSILSGYLGMSIATYANARTALEARKGIAPAFMAAFRSGAVMGFLLAGNALLVLFLLLLVLKKVFGDDWEGLYEAITGYGLGGSSIALFGRVGGGIYTKAADVGADLVGKIEKDIPEDDPRNPAVIADNVGDNVGDIAGMGADLFGSFAEATCAALVVSSVSALGAEHSWVGMCYPLLITASGIIVCMLTTLIATDLKPARVVSEIENTLKGQLIISTLAMTPVVYVISVCALPAEFTGIFSEEPERVVKNWHMFFCVAAGLWGGLVIGLVTEYYTSNRYTPVQDVADACRTGAATNIIFGMALGYKSAIVPCLIMAASIFTGFTLAHMYGIACAALGMLATISTCLAIDAYGPISDNAGGIAEMAGMGEDIRERTDALDAAGNTTAAIGKGFAIGSAALVSLALFGAYVTRAGISMVDSSILDPEVFSGLLVGAMLPYWFSAMTMKSVGKAALAMVEEVRRQFNTIPGLMEGTARPDYRRCVEISTAASISEMVPPGILVMGTPLIVGTLFGVRALAGVLAGSLVSGVQMAVSMSNTGGAWDNAKKYVEAGASEHARELGGKGSDCHKAAVIGDTVGDPLKDTSGPSLNILIKLMAVESLVLAPFFLAHTKDGLIFQLACASTMSMIQRLSGCLAQTLRLASQRHTASQQQQAAFHLSATLEARQRKGAAATSSSDDDSDSEAATSSRKAAHPRSQEEQHAAHQHAASAHDQSSDVAEDEDEDAFAANASKCDVQQLISPALAAALEATGDGEEEADRAMEELHAAVKALEKGQILPGDEPASEDELRLVAEAIDLYFLAAEEEEPDMDGLEGFDRDLLAALSDTLKEVLDDPARTQTVNVAPAGRLPWEILEVDEETPMVTWGVDLTEGRAADPWKNALLSEEVKQRIYDMHDSEGWDVLALADHFRIRVQRVMAIIALKDKEKQAKEAGEPLNTELAEAMEKHFEAHEVLGSGERHHVVLPSFPNYQELTEADADRLAAMLEQRLGKRFEDITEDDMTAEIAAELLAATGMDKRAVEEQLAAREEAHLIDEFRRNLEYNLGKSGTSLSRASRKTHPPKRPEGGWGLLVQPLGKAARSARRKAYVAMPDGSQRPLTGDEQVHVERQQPRPRRKIA
ncbi:Pyrophosphate-energized vacuolar membrane proton pump [Chlorella vulgaris]